MSNAYDIIGAAERVAATAPAIVVYPMDTHGFQCPVCQVTYAGRPLLYNLCYGQQPLLQFCAACADAVHADLHTVLID